MSRTQTTLFNLDEYETISGADYRWDTIGRDPYWDEICDRADRLKRTRRGTQAGHASGWITYQDKISKSGITTRYYAYRWFLSTGRIGYRSLNRVAVGDVQDMIDRGDCVSKILASICDRRVTPCVKLVKQ